MKSNPDILAAHGMRSLPKMPVRNWWLWPQPVPPGLYGKEWGSTLWITTNHLPSVASFCHQPDAMVLALDAGGLHPFLASALDSGMIEDVMRYEQFALPGGDKTIIIDPHLVRRLSTEESPDDSGLGVKVVSAPHADRSQIAQRLAGAFLLTLGQAILFAPPLLLFGWPNLMVGLSILFLAGLILGLLWPLPKQKCMKCRFVLSILSTLLAAIVAGLWLGIQSESFAWLVSGWWLSSFWLSFVFVGTK